MKDLFIKRIGSLARLHIAIISLLWFILPIRNDLAYATILGKYIYVPIFICIINVLINRLFPNNMQSKLTLFISLIPFFIWLLEILAISIFLMLMFPLWIINANIVAIVEIAVCIGIILFHWKKKTNSLKSKALVITCITIVVMWVLPDVLRFTWAWLKSIYLSADCFIPDLPWSVFVAKQ